MTHIDVGFSRQVALVIGVQPSVLVLCGAKDGDVIKDSRTAIRANGGYPAACDCAACKGIAEIMFYEDMDPWDARRAYRTRMGSDGGQA